MFKLGKSVSLSVVGLMACLSDLGSWMRVNSLMLMIMALTGLDDSGRWQVLWITAQLHTGHRGPWMEIGRLVLLRVVRHCMLLLMHLLLLLMMMLLMLLLLLDLMMHVHTMGVDMRVLDGLAH